MIREQLTAARNYYIQLTSDDSGRPSLSKSILFWTAFTAGCIMWKLTVTEKLSIDYLIVFLTWGSGHQLTSKFLDIKGEKE
jgi:hypothetical protein